MNNKINSTPEQNEFDEFDLDNMQLSDEQIKMYSDFEDEPQYESAPDTVEPGDVNGAYKQCVEEIQTSINQFFRFINEWCLSDDVAKAKQCVDDIEKINKVLFSIQYGEYNF